MRARRPSVGRMAYLVVEDWHTECGACGYGAGGWIESPLDGGNPILSPESRACPRCGVAFARVVDVSTGTVSYPPVDRAA